MSKPATSSGLTPALVVVDSRNIFHQTDAATGFRMRPQVQGIVEAMRDYGFDALEVHVGLALPRSQDWAQLSSAAKANSDYMNEIDAHQRGSVLLGELHRKDKAGGGYVVEEKQVDVACAVDICRHASQMAHHNSPFRAIILLSQDTDLTPAVKYAEEINVPLVLGAHERVERRGFPYILLTERTLRAMGHIREPVAGHALRTAVAKAVSGPDLWDDWTIGEHDPHRERVLVSAADGLRGVVKPHLVVGKNVGDTVRLRVAGVDWGRRRRLPFPLVVCTTTNPSSAHDHRADYERRFVRGRRALTELILDRPVGNKSRLNYPAGGVASGTEVLIDVSDPKRPLVVGALTIPASRDLAQAKPFCVEPVSRLSDTATIAKTASGRVVVSHSKADPPKLGSRYVAVLVESGKQSVVVKLISSPLPS